MNRTPNHHYPLLQASTIMLRVQKTGPLATQLILVAVFLLFTLHPYGVRTAAAHGQAVSDPIHQFSESTGSLSLIWSSADTDESYSLAWGDVDSDGDLDLAVGNDGQPNRLYLNEDGALSADAAWSSSESPNWTSSLAWGDVDNDGDLDLAVGNKLSPVRVYTNENSALQTTAGWQSTWEETTTAVAWGDYNNDGLLDLAVANDNAPTRIYRNQNGRLIDVPMWSSQENNNASSLAWGDADHDGDLDLAVGNIRQPVRIYENIRSSSPSDTTEPVFTFNLNRRAAWASSDQLITRSIAWADFDQDGYLDLAIGNDGQASQVCRNNQGALTSSTGAWCTVIWSTNGTDKTHSLALGDFDKDGDPDLLTGNYLEPNRLYRNDNGELTQTAIWNSEEFDSTEALAWGDVDNDGDLDLAVANSGNNGEPNRLYRNENSMLASEASQSTAETDWTTSLAWGDVDNDGDLDLAVGNYHDELNRIYTNQDGALTLNPDWTPSQLDYTTSLAWGDVDNDGDLDLAVGNKNQPNRVYLNHAGALEDTPTWSSEEEDQTTSLAWGDVDNDGDLDLAAGKDGQPNCIYQNEHGVLSPTASWFSSDSDPTTSLAWGDIDNDGDLDLATGNDNQPIRIYRNDNGTLSNASFWQSGVSEHTTSIAWGDVDGDGDLDLAAGNNQQPTRLYRNDQGWLTLQPTWSSIIADQTLSIAWADYDNDGDLDLVTGNDRQPIRLYRNDNGTLTTHAIWSSGLSDRTFSVSWGDIDNDGDLDLAAGNFGANRIYPNLRDGRHSQAGLPILKVFQPGLNAGYLADPKIWTGRYLPIRFQIPSNTPDGRGKVTAQYSMDGGGQWFTALAGPEIVLEDQETGDQVFNWDVYGSEFFGKSDLVVLRLTITSTLLNQTAGIPGPYLYGAYSSQTLPFRVRGAQVQVLQENGQPAPGAMVYRLPAESGAATPFADLSGHPYQTDILGYLQGFGSLITGDQLVTLWPVVSQPENTLYFTNAPVTEQGLAGQPIEQPGIKTLVVDDAYPLLLFDLNISIEWDASHDPQYQELLARDIDRASELVYDWSNGRAALGKVRVYQDREKWMDPDTHIQIMASNRLRPNAAVGGFTNESRQDPGNDFMTYRPGQIHMSPTWNRYGDASGSLGEDWPRALAHELGHYLFYLDDDYLGVDPNGLIAPMDNCPSAMADPYREDWSEFLFPDQWTGDCLHTLAQQNTGRSNWETITTFYPPLAGAVQNPGPQEMPLPLTTLIWVSPASDIQLVQAPIFPITGPDGKRSIPGPGARAFLFRSETLIDLGQPVLDHVTARGARSGDELCVYSLSENRFGCITVGSSVSPIQLKEAAPLETYLQAIALDAQTLQVRASNLPSRKSVRARLYRSDGSAFPEQVMTENEGIYTTTFADTRPIPEGYVRVSVYGQPGWEAVISYSLGGSPAKGWERSSPATSVDGNAILYGKNLVFPSGEFFGLQSVINPPSIPEWASLTGSAYRLFRSTNAPALNCDPDNTECRPVSIAFYYRGSDVPPGEEPLLKIYYLDGETWEPLATTLNQDRNIASAPTRGEGLYALFSTYEIALGGPGWVQIPYAILGQRSIPSALAPIDGLYTVVYHWAPPSLENPQGIWSIYDPAVPDWANDFTNFEFGKVYWIYLTENVPYLPMKGAQLSTSSSFQVAVLSPTAIQPPAVYYGTAEGLPAGATIQIRANQQSCGQATTQQIEEQVVYRIQIPAGSCGEPSANLQLQIGPGFISTIPGWNNTRMQPVDLSITLTWIYALPLIGR